MTREERKITVLLEMTLITCIGIDGQFAKSGNSLRSSPSLNTGSLGALLWYLPGML